jgi:hypothetical protein
MQRRNEKVGTDLNLGKYQKSVVGYFEFGGGVLAASAVAHYQKVSFID